MLVRGKVESQPEIKDSKRQPNMYFMIMGHIWVKNGA